VHVPIPFGSLARRVRGAYSYFRTGVNVDGRAWLCDKSHGPWAIIGDVEIGTAPVAQHIDVELRFWNRRGGRVTVIELAEINLPLRNFELALAEWRDFEPVELEEGGAPQKREFVLVPRDASKGRVEAAMGDQLDLAFRPSRGSERFARPRVRLILT
jgi:hypothetical protein